VDADKCAGCGEAGAFEQVFLYDRTRRTQEETQADMSCPYCESASGLTILGSRAASLTSIALSQLYTSPFNREKRALAFSDNVQDASHRSGFFAARTFRVNLRTAIRRVIAAATGPLTLADLEARFLEFWRKELGELDFIGIFLAPNMEWLSDYESLVKQGRLPAGSNLLKLVERRTAWEITGEFCFNSRIGRTLEKSGAAIAFVDPQRVAPLPAKLVTRLPSLSRIGQCSWMRRRILATKHSVCSAPWFLRPKMTFFLWVMRTSAFMDIRSSCRGVASRFGGAAGNSGSTTARQKN
jgi:DEAD/DEAH box helicase domain-containing protein